MNHTRREKRVTRQQVMLSDAEVELLKDWQFANRISSTSEAIRALLAIGLTRSAGVELGENSSD